MSTTKGTILPFPSLLHSHSLSQMRCEFKEGAHSCSRCTTGRHECILEERKPKRPGCVKPYSILRHKADFRLRSEKETLQQKLKQREQEIEDLVTNVRKEAPAFTPLTFVPPRLQLSADQRERFKNVLANASTTRRPGPAQLEDIRSLLENEDWSSSGDSASDSSDDAASRNSPLGDSHDVSNRNRAPIAVMAEFSMNHEGGPTYFQPGKHTRLENKPDSHVSPQDPFRAEPFNKS